MKGDDDFLDSEGSKVRLTFALAVAAVVLVVGVGAMREARDASTKATPRHAHTPTPGHKVEDTTGPAIEIGSPTKGLHPFRRYTLKGTIDEPALLRINGTKVRAKKGGFEKSFPVPPRRVTVVAVDEAGNRTKERFDLRTRYLPIRGIHVSAFAWATPSYRNALEKYVRNGLVNTIELDLKDESGDIGYDSKIPLARRIGAARGIYDLKATIRRIHRLGGRVVGRLVAFRDPILATASWNRGHRERVVQTPGGRPYTGYGGFTNFADDTVRRYNRDIALEAARAGIDDVLFDYIRRPDGPLRNLRFPGLETSPERAIASFVAETKQRLEPLGARVGVSVYGIAATRPKEIAQDIPKLARAADYISPMLYPSHWASGEYNVGHPNARPYDIVRRSLRDFIKKTKGTEARIIPWLQDFSLGIRYGRAEVCAQMRATRDAGIKEWFLWDPHVTYMIPPQLTSCRS